MELAIFLIVMLAFWLFVRVEQRHHNDKRPPPLPRARLVGGFVPGKTVAWMPVAAFSAMCIIGAVLALVRPLAPPFSGRWALVYAPVYNVLGTYGMAYIFFAAAVLCASLAIRRHVATAKQRSKENAA